MINWEDTLIDDRYDNLWKPKNGKAIKIKKMDDDYIKNCIKVLDKIMSAYPGEQIYYGDSDYAEMAVEGENARNEALLEQLERKKFVLKSELERRIKLNDHR